MASKRRHRRSPEHGFTLIEVMIVVVIIAVLVAVVLPSFMSESTKTKEKAEVSAFFAELQAREEQYKVEFGSYLAAAQCPPGAPSAATQLVTTACSQTGGLWQGATPNLRLNVNPPMDEAYCVYTIEANTGAAGAVVPAGFTMTKPAGPWFFVLAECDLDGDGTKAQFVMTSVNSSIQAVNEGE